MKKLSILLATFILAVTALISGCGSSSVADEFVGTWVSNNGYTYISIEKKGTKKFLLLIDISMIKKITQIYLKVIQVS